MLWYKAWLETRWRTLMPIGMISFVLFQARTHLSIEPGPRSTVTGLAIFWIVAAVVLAGGGIRTEAPFRAQKGIHGSMYFTLSLPVSRFRLLMSRALFGMLVTSCVILAACVASWCLLPEVRALVAPADALHYLLTVLVCDAAIYGLGTFFATFLDQQWQMLATMMSVIASGWIFRHLGMPQYLDVGRAMGELSPLVTHQIPWASIGVSVLATVVFLAVAAKIVEMKEY